MSARKWKVIGEAEWLQLKALMPTLRTEDLRTAGLSAEPPWSGVPQHTLDELEAALVSLAGVYAARPDLQGFCRSEVIRAKDRAKIITVAPNVPEQTRKVKREMVEWMLVWLGDPSLFAPWIRIRRILVASPQL